MFVFFSFLWKVVIIDIELKIVFMVMLVSIFCLCKGIFSLLYMFSRLGLILFNDFGLFFMFFGDE